MLAMLYKRFPLVTFHNFGNIHLLGIFIHFAILG